jgi:hypothetical protein
MKLGMSSPVRSIFVVALCFSLAVNWWMMAELSETHIRPKKGKDYSVEMKSFLDGKWSEVVLVHGYLDNYAVAKYLVEVAEKEEAAKGGREKGSFRVKAH